MLSSRGNQRESMSKNTLFIRFKRGIALYAITSMVFTASFGPFSYAYAQEVPADPLTPEECELAQGFWNGTNCEEVSTCDEGFVYNTETNECDPIESEQCPAGQVGTPPDCSTPEPEQCPEGQV